MALETNSEEYAWEGTCSFGGSKLRYEKGMAIVQVCPFQGSPLKGVCMRPVCRSKSCFVESSNQEAGQILKKCKWLAITGRSFIFNTFGIPGAVLRVTCQGCRAGVVSDACIHHITSRPRRPQQHLTVLILALQTHGVCCSIVFEDGSF